MKQYKELVKTVLDFGELKQNRTGVDTLDSFGHTIKFDLRKGFPLGTLRKMPWRSIVSELLWFIKGSTNVNELRKIQHGENSNKRTIWDDNYEHQAVELGYQNGELGPIYGGQWRKKYLKDNQEISRAVLTDPLKEAIDLIKNDPYSRRIIVNSWQVNDLRKMALPPCHYSFQFNVSADGKYLDLMWTMRSSDLGCGLYYNVASYGLLLSIIAKITNKEPRYLIGSLGSVHIYKNHIEQFNELLKRDTLELPTLKIANHIKTLEDVEKSIPDDYEIENYNCHPTMKFEMVV